MASPSDCRRFRDNYLREQEGIAMYRALAAAERDRQRAEIFEKLAGAEERHSKRWADLLDEAGEPLPVFKPGRRVRLIGHLARRVGTQNLLPIVRGFELRDKDAYTDQHEALGLPAAERSHQRTIRAMGEGSELGAPAILSGERWHRAGYGGSLRAAVFGVNDGLVSNFGLVMGVAGAAADPSFVLLAGVAGLLAGAFSMAAGEYISVRSQLELYEQQIELERQELQRAPDEELEELSLIYQAKGIPAEQAEALASSILADPQTAIDTLAREELGLDPKSLGSPWTAALSSFLAFAAGAVVPVAPYLIFSGGAAFYASAASAGTALFIVGALISLFTGRGTAFSGLRMLIIGAMAAVAAYLIGRLLGVTVAG